MERRDPRSERAFLFRAEPRDGPAQRRYAPPFRRPRLVPHLHDGLMVGLVSLIGGGDPRWAVLPSGIAWTAGVVFAFPLARRCVPRSGAVAWLIADSDARAPRWRSFPDCSLRPTRRDAGSPEPLSAGGPPDVSAHRLPGDDLEEAGRL